MYCAHCGQEVQTLAARCPACGHPASGAPAVGKGMTGAAIAIIIVVVGMVVVAVIGIIAAIAIPNLLNAINRGRQKRTMADMRTIATAVEAHAVDIGSYPAADTIEELAQAIEPTYLRAMPTTDGWQHPLEYACWQVDTESPGCDSYAIVSPARDGVFEVDDLRDYGEYEERTFNFDRDIVYRDGVFVQIPEGISPR